MPREIRAREAWLERYVQSAMRERTLSGRDSNRALRDLRAIRYSEQAMLRNNLGELSPRNQEIIVMRLDRLSNQLGVTSFEDERRY